MSIRSKSTITFAAAFICLMVLSSCAERVCPANGRSIYHRQLTKINSKRKRQRGLFPKSMHRNKRKYKQPETSEEEEIEEF